jgi:hypothetical protein
MPAECREVVLVAVTCQTTQIPFYTGRDMLSLIGHALLLSGECGPVQTALCRFDDFDGAATAPDNTIVHFRTLHAIPAGVHCLRGWSVDVGLP